MESENDNENESEGSSASRDVVLVPQRNSSTTPHPEYVKRSSSKMLNDDKISSFILKNIYELIRFISFEDKPVDTLIKEAFQEFEFQMS